jgi:hypothetical protein
MFSSGLGYMAAAMIVVFVFKDRLRLVGILLIVIAILTLIAMSAFGIVSLGMLLAAGIVALRYKLRKDETRTPSSSTTTDKSAI